LSFLRRSKTAVNNLNKLALQAKNAYIACMKTKQYTIRGIPNAIDQRVREQSRKTHQSLNSIVLDALRRGLGLTDPPQEFHDLDDLAGTWINDPEFDHAMEMFESVDEDLWK
jgi:hypothetical protein